MKNIVEPSLIDGSIDAPASKSYAQRAVAAALLADGVSTLDGITSCDDTEAALRVAEALGATIERHRRIVRISGGLAPRRALLDCGEAGLCIRMFLPVAALVSTRLTLTGESQLKRRPMDFVEAPLRELGVTVCTDRGRPPITVEGPLLGGVARVDGSVSSQFITGLLLAAPLAPQATTLHVDQPKSTPYLDMTLEVLRHFGIHVAHENYRRFEIAGGQRYRACRYRVEGDWSGGAFALVAGAIAGSVRVGGLNPRSLQADRAILDALRLAGARLTVADESVSVATDALTAFDFDATDCPDLFPPLVALAAYCAGVSRIRGVSRLKHKESDRGEALRDEFGALGIAISFSDDTMRVEGGAPSGGRVDSHGDHRIAMAAAVTALGASGRVEIEHPVCVAKSYPGFFDDLARLGGTISSME